MDTIPRSTQHLLVQRYPQLEGAAWQLHPQHRGFSGAVIAQARTATQTWCVRRWPRETLPPARILGLHQLLQHIARAGNPHVAVPIVSRSYSTCPLIEGHLWQVEPWLPGSANYHNHPSPIKLAAAMRALAHWHLCAHSYVPAASHAIWFGSRLGPSPSLVERFAHVRDQHSQLAALVPPARAVQPELAFLMEWPALLQATTSFILAELRRGRDLQVALQPCLRDVWHDHLLFINNDVTGLIDPAATRTETVATDLARLLGSLVGNDTAQWAHAIAHYAQVRPLSLAETELVPILDVSGVWLSATYWLRHLDSATVSHFDDRLPPRLKRLDARLRQLLPHRE